MDLRGNVALVVGCGQARPVTAVGRSGWPHSAPRWRCSTAIRRCSRPGSPAAGGHALALAGDPCDGQSVRAAVSRLLTAWERIDILVTGVDGLAEVAPAVSGYLPEAARTSTRGVADLIVLGPSGSRRAQAEARIREIRRQLAGEPVRVELVDCPPGRPVESPAGCWS